LVRVGGDIAFYRDMAGAALDIDRRDAATVDCVRRVNLRAEAGRLRGHVTVQGNAGGAIDIDRGCAVGRRGAGQQRAIGGDVGVAAVERDRRIGVTRCGDAAGRDPGLAVHGDCGDAVAGGGGDRIFDHDLSVDGGQVDLGAAAGGGRSGTGPGRGLVRAGFGVGRVALVGT